MYQVPLVVYEQLKGATPEEKRDIVLSLIEEHPQHRLELPERDGLRADLSYVDLSREALQELVEQRAGATPPWWNARLQPTYLLGAHLQGANLEGARLQGADLIGANLQNANLFWANLRGAYLGGADLRDADLGAAKLQNAALGGAKLQNANLCSADLQDVFLHEANLQNAKLRGARLQGADLSGSKMRHCYLSGAWLDGTRLRREQIEEGVGEELDGDYTEAKVAYLRLKQNFGGLGDYAAFSWAYRRERRMEKREALERARDARARRDWKEALYSYGKVFFDQTVELVCDYGEGVWRVLVCLALLWLGFALFYGITGHVRSDSGLNHITRNVWDLLSFSLAPMVTLEAPGLYAYPTRAIRILMPLQAALGIFFLGLLGFVAGNRIRRS